MGRTSGAVSDTECRRGVRFLAHPMASGTIRMCTPVYVVLRKLVEIQTLVFSEPNSLFSGEI
jgi:hypothetical protein